MKKSFSLMEIVIATVLLSVVMLSLYKVKGNSLFLIDKAQDSKKSLAHITLVMDATNYSKRNENIYLDRYFNIKDDDIRREFSDVKLKVKDDFIKSDEIEIEDIQIKRNFYKTLYSFEKGMSRPIYRFEIEL